MDMHKVVKKVGIAAAAIVGAKYLDAKLDVYHDYLLVRAAIIGKLQAKKLVAQDKANFFFILEDQANAIPNHILLYYQGQEWTYHQVRLIAQRFGNYFLSLGLNSGDHVAMDFTNKPEFIFIWLGLLSIGAVPALINYNLTTKPLLHCIQAANAKLLIFDSEIASNVKTIKDELNIPSICLVDPSDSAQDLSWTRTVTTKEIELHPDTRPPDSLRKGKQLTDMEMLMFTSGTTGLPKPAIISFNKLANAPIVFYNWAQITSKDRFYSCMPLYHATALVLGIAMIIRVGGTFVLGHKFSTAGFWDEVRNSKATCIEYVGEMCRYLLAPPPSPRDKEHSVKLVFGNGMRPDVWNRFRERFGIDTVCELYAASEGNGTQLNRSSGEYGAGCVGRLGWIGQLFIGSTTVIVKIDPITEQIERGPDGLCVKVGPNETGEMLFLIEGNGQIDVSRAFQGYYGNPTASQKKIVRDVVKKGDVYFRTGDVLLTKQDGWRRYTFFEDRIGDTFRWKGENVSTMEVAAVIGSYPGVDDANVYGIRLPNHDGRAGCAAIAVHHSSPPHFGDLAKYLKKSLPRYAVPLFLRLTDSMRLTGNMKHQKHEMREEGVDLEKCREKVLWLKNDEYVDFTKEDWEGLKAGQVKL